MTLASSTSTRRADRVVLHNLGWQQFEQILQNLGDARSARVAYDRGDLEIMTPLPEHEYFKETLSDAVKDVADELDLDYECYGSTTWKRELELAGVESDNCFYFQNELQVRGKLAFDLEFDPPPDLALEIDITNKSLNRFPIYARLGVPEIWCYDSGQLIIYRLNGSQYQTVQQSSIFPGLAIQELPNLVQQNRDRGRRVLRKAIRAWAKAQIV